MVLGGFTIALGLGIGHSGGRMGFPRVCGIIVIVCGWFKWLFVRRVAFMSLRCLKVPDGVEYFSIHDV